MVDVFTPLPPSAVTLAPGRYWQVRHAGRNYLASLRTADLLQNHYLEAGVWAPPAHPGDIHWGWESPTSLVRGHFLGHWMSAAAEHGASGDEEMGGRVRHVVRELARCQQENGGEWVASIPEKYLRWSEGDKPVWAPGYVAHKTLMGLWDAWALLGDDAALDVLVNAARWYSRWVGSMSRETLDHVLDRETGGMLEVWADLYAVTGAQEHLDLVTAYDRRLLFDALAAGEDELTNRHANTTVPEVLGAARAFEVTGEKRWRLVVENYWRWAVTERGAFATGGQSSGELWTPPQQFAARLGDKTQEHCVVYNMRRLAEVLLRWTGEATYADYLERNLVNGTLAQINPRTGMVTYFLPLQPGASKKWTSPREDFPCCLGTAVQAAARIGRDTYFRTDDGIAVTYYQPSRATWTQDGTEVSLDVATDENHRPGFIREFDAAEQPHRPAAHRVRLTLSATAPVATRLALRIPWWVSGPPVLRVDGRPAPTTGSRPGFVDVDVTGDRCVIELDLPRALTAEPLPDRPTTVAFMDGPLVLAGLVDEERVLHGDPADPSTMLTLTNEREWNTWLHGWQTTGQDRGFRLVPLRDVDDQPYTVYFPVTSS